jgi:hypothetical protein
MGPRGTRAGPHGEARGPPDKAGMQTGHLAAVRINGYKECLICWNWACLFRDVARRVLGCETTDTLSDFTPPWPSNNKMHPVLWCSGRWTVVLGNRRQSRAIAEAMGPPMLRRRSWRRWRAAAVYG